MQKIAINGSYGGWGLSLAARQLYLECEGTAFTMEYETNYKGELEKKPELFSNGKFLSEYCEKFHENMKRDDPILIHVIETLGKDAAGFCATPSIVEIPDGIEWQIEEYDGSEWVAERHRVWH